MVGNERTGRRAAGDGRWGRVEGSEVERGTSSSSTFSIGGYREGGERPSGACARVWPLTCPFHDRRDERSAVFMRMTSFSSSSISQEASPTCTPSAVYSTVRRRWDEMALDGFPLLLVASLLPLEPVAVLWRTIGWVCDPCGAEGKVLAALRIDDKAAPPAEEDHRRLLLLFRTIEWGRPPSFTFSCVSVSSSSWEGEEKGEEEGSGGERARRGCNTTRWRRVRRARRSFGTTVPSETGGGSPPLGVVSFSFSPWAREGARACGNSTSRRLLLGVLSLLLEWSTAFPSSASRLAPAEEGERERGSWRGDGSGAALEACTASPFFSSSPSCGAEEDTIFRFFFFFFFHPRTSASVGSPSREADAGTSGEDERSGDVLAATVRFRRFFLDDFTTGTLPSCVGGGGEERDGEGGEEVLRHTDEAGRASASPPPSPLDNTSNGEKRGGSRGRSGGSSTATGELDGEGNGMAAVGRGGGEEASAPPVRLTRTSCPSCGGGGGGTAGSTSHCAASSFRLDARRREVEERAEAEVSSSSSSFFWIRFFFLTIVFFLFVVVVAPSASIAGGLPSMRRAGAKGIGVVSFDTMRFLRTSTRRRFFSANASASCCSFRL